MQQKCLCKLKFNGWYFNFNKNKPSFERNDAIGKYLINLIVKLKNITKTTDSVINLLYNIEKHPELRNWFLSLVKSHTNKTCYGWQYHTKVLKINPSCKLHKHNIKKFSQKR